MISTASRVPDQALTAAMHLPWPLDRLTFALLRRVFQAWGRANGTVVGIRFGNVQIRAPLDHPAVYWRHRPVGANLNYLRLVKATLAVRKGAIVDVGANIGDGVALLRSGGVDVPICAIEGADSFLSLLRADPRSWDSRASG